MATAETLKKIIADRKAAEQQEAVDPQVAAIQGHIVEKQAQDTAFGIGKRAVGLFGRGAMSLADAPAVFEVLGDMFPEDLKSGFLGLSPKQLSNETIYCGGRFSFTRYKRTVNECIVSFVSHCKRINN